MEDTIVLKGYFAYMLRVDIAHDKALPLFNKWKEMYKCTHWIIGLEFGSETGKEHIQGIVWFECLQSMPKLRNYFRDKVDKKKQAVAFTSAKKITNLSKYCMKGGVFDTNLSQSQIESIGKWNVGDGSIYKFTKDLCDLIERLIEENKHTMTQICSYTSDLLGEHYLVMEILKFYRLKDKRPSKSTIDYMLWKYNVVDDNAWYIRHYQ